jgi:hypothetical protein
MSEYDWLSLSSVDDFYGEFAAVLQPQKLFLLGAAFLRRVWVKLPAESSRLAVEAAERYATGRAGVLELLQTWTRARADPDKALWLGPYWQDPDLGPCGCAYCEEAENRAAAPLEEMPIHPGVQEAIRTPGWFAATAACTARTLADDAEREPDAQFLLYRDIVGDPFDPGQPAPACVCDSVTVRQLLRCLDGQHVPDPVAILALADALEEAHCDEQQILEHLREQGPHVHGCSVLQRLLGRATIELPLDDAVIWQHETRWGR